MFRRNRGNWGMARDIILAILLLVVFVRITLYKIQYESKSAKLPEEKQQIVKEDSILVEENEEEEHKDLIIPSTADLVIDPWEELLNIDKEMQMMMTSMSCQRKYNSEFKVQETSQQRYWTLALKYQEIRKTVPFLSEQGKDIPITTPRFPFANWGCHSQNEEDAILLYIFSIIGVTNRKAVEICSGIGYENNVANLVIYHNWTALMIDGDEGNIKAAKKFYANRQAFPSTYGLALPQQLWIDRETINTVLSKQENGLFVGEIDLFSLDMDGVDYWIWKEIRVFRPRVVVVEWQDIWKKNEAKTRPYAKDFFSHHVKEAQGASLLAFVRLAADKGYRLIGCIRGGYNAWFLRDDIVAPELYTYPIEGCYIHDTGQWAEELTRRRKNGITLSWEDIPF
jgi:hypothetical protein